METEDLEKQPGLNFEMAREDIEMQELLGSFRLLMERKNQVQYQASPEPPRETVLQRLENTNGTDLYPTNPTELSKYFICLKGKQRSKQLKYAMLLVGLSIAIVSSVVVATVLLNSLLDNRPDAPQGCPKVHNTTKWKPLQLTSSSEVMNLCQYKSVSLMLTDGAKFANGLFPILRCPENVKSLEIYTNGLTGLQFYALFDKFQHIRSLSFIGSKLSGNINPKKSIESKYKLRTTVTNLRFVDIQNCGSIFQNVIEMFDMPCLKRIDFDCVVFSTGDVSVIYNLTKDLNTLSDIHCSNANYCDGVVRNLQPSGIEVTFDEKYC